MKSHAPRSLPLLLLASLVAGCSDGGGGGGGTPPLLPATQGDLLLWIDRGTGATESRASAGLAGFPRDEDDPALCLAFDPNTDTLLGTDESSGQLFAIDTNTGHLTAIGSLGGEGPGAIALDPVNDRLYGVDGGGRFRSFDPRTGRATEIEDVGRDHIVALAFDPHALDMLGMPLPLGRLYGADLFADELVEIDPSNGEIVNALPFGATVEAMAFDLNTRTLFGAGAGKLLRIDTSLGTATEIGPLAFAVRNLTFDPDTDRLFGTVGGQRLVEIEVATAATRVVAAYGFSNVEGLAFERDARVIYGTSTATDELIQIDYHNGVGTRIGALGFEHVSALAFDAFTDTLYGADNASGQLITIDLATGTGTAVGPLGFGRVDGLAFDTRRGILFGASAESDELLIVDTATGAASSVGPLGQDFSSLEYDGGTDTLYGTNTAQLFEIDKTTGATELIGSFNIGGPTFVGEVLCLAFDPLWDSLYGVDVNFRQLVSIDPRSARTTFQRTGGFFQIEGLACDPGSFLAFGSSGGRLLVMDVMGFGTASVGSLGAEVLGLAFDPDTGTLYGSAEFGELHTIDVASGASTLVGAGPATVEGLAFDPVSDVLYGSTTLPGQLIRIDPASGAQTVVGPIGFDNVEGLAFDRETNGLYGTDTETRQLLRIDTRTGAGRVVGPTGYAASGLGERIRFPLARQR